MNFRYAWNVILQKQRPILGIVSGNGRLSSVPFWNQTFNLTMSSPEIKRIPVHRTNYENNFAHRIMRENVQYHNSMFAEERHVKNHSELIEDLRESKEPGGQTAEHLTQLCEKISQNMQSLSEEDLMAALNAIQFWPLEFKVGDLFLSLIKELDNECKARLRNWTADQALLVADLWHRASFARTSNFVWLCIKRYLKSLRSLTKPQVVQLMFLVNICRKFPPIAQFEIEFYLVQVLNEMSLDEMAIVSMAFFKTQTKMLNKKSVALIMDKLIDEIGTCNSSYTLGMLTKIIKYSVVPIQEERLAILQDKLKNELDRFSLTTVTHVALLGTGIQSCNYDLINATLNRFKSDMGQARLKDLERVMFILALFDVKDQAFVEAVLQRVETMEDDIRDFPVALLSLVHYLTSMKVYPHHLINRVLSPEFRDTILSLKKHSRELLAVDANVEIECPGYQGHRMDPRLRRTTARDTNFIPSEKSPTATIQISYALECTLRRLYTSDHVFYGAILPHYNIYDFVLKFDIKGRSLAIPQDWGKLVWGEVKRPPDREHIWLCVLVGGWNLLIRHSNKPLGTTAAKIRQLETLGYHTLMVPWYQWKHVEEDNRTEYVQQMIVNKLDSIIQKTKKS